MKFTKEEAIKALEAKIPAKDKDLDLSRTIREAVENGCEMVGDESEMELEAFVNVVFKTVKTAIGLAHKENSNVASRLQEQIAALQKQLEDRPKQSDDSTEEKGLQELLKRIQALESDKAEKEKAMSISQKKKDIADKIVAGGVKDTEWVNSMLSQVSITETTDSEQKAKDLIALYNKFSAKGGTKTTPKTTGGDTNDSYVKDTLDRVKSLMRQKEGLMGHSTVETGNV